MGLEAETYLQRRRDVEARLPQDGKLWDAMFDALQQQYQWNRTMRDRVQAAEVQAEHDVAIPIAVNLALVRDGDLIVSDMYLPADVILSLLRHCGMDKQVTMRVSNGGKHHGFIWKQLLAEGWRIEEHLGDNTHSDVTQARAHGINASATDVHAWRGGEAALLAEPAWAPHAHAIRRLRLSNPFYYEDATVTTRTAESAPLAARIWDEQARIFLPTCIYVARRIDEHMQRDGLTRVLFLTRDGTAMRAVFDALYGWRGYVSAPLFASRRLHSAGGPVYDAYLQRMYVVNETLLVDLNGAFNTGRGLYTRLFGALPPLVLVRHDDTGTRYPGVEGIFGLKQGIMEIFARGLERAAASLDFLFGDSSLTGVPTVIESRTAERPNIEAAKAAILATRLLVDWLPLAPADGGHDSDRSAFTRMAALANGPWPVHSSLEFVEMH